MSTAIPSLLLCGAWLCLFAALAFDIHVIAEIRREKKEGVLIIPTNGE